ncbi:MAG TPA: hypothetical protein VF784_08515 [Anaerolineales bacterium]
MYGTAVITILLVLRVLIPIGLLLCLGEMARPRQPIDLNRASGQA